MLKKGYAFSLLLLFCLFSSQTGPNFYPFSPPKNPENPRHFNPLIKDRINVSIHDILEQDAKEAQNKKEKNPFYAFKPNEPAPIVVHPKAEEPSEKVKKSEPAHAESQTILINFSDVSIIELLRFISRVSNQNFVFDEKDLQFNVTVVSEEPTTIENILTALYQELRIHNLELIEQGNNMIIHKNPRVNSISRVVSDSLQDIAKQSDTEIVTRVFRLNTLEPEKAASIVRPLTSQQAIISPVVSPNTLIVTDLVTNIEQIHLLLKSLDSPNSGLVIGQYAVKSMTVPDIQKLTQEIMGPIAQGQTLIFVPHLSTKSIFIIGAPYLVERTLLMMKYVDQNEAATQIHDLDNIRGGAGKGQWKLDENGNWIFTPAVSELARSPVTNEQFLDQLRKKHGLKVLGRELTDSESLLMEKLQNELHGKVTLPPNNDELDILNKLQNKLLQGELDRELSSDEMYLMKKLERLFTEGELGHNLSPEELFFKGKFADRAKAIDLERQSPPKGKWFVDDTGKWHFLPEGASEYGLTEPRTLGRDLAPEGEWYQDLDGRWRFKLGPCGRITAKDLSPQLEMSDELPFGSVESTRFLIHKLQNRQGDEIVYALESIAYSLQSCGNPNQDLICTINSVQWIESSNSLIFTGTTASLEKMKELVNEIDAPARQVFIEMLILETTIDDALTYGVNWATRFGGGLDSGSQAFLTAGSPLAQVMNTTGSNLTPNAKNLARQSGFNQGVIGETLSKDGVLYRSMGSLVTAIHNRTDTRIVMNPKLLVEDNQEAEIFVGINTSFKTQSIANDQGALLTSNFEFRDVGTTLRLTPMIGNNNVVTLDIYQETSSVLNGSGIGGGSSGGGGGGGGNTAATENIGPSTNVNKTITRVHIPDKYFLVISGMMQEENDIIRAQVPCLGGVPLIGALFGDRTHNDSKRNLMIFIRPEIIDTVEEIQHLTKHQQDIYKTEDRMKSTWKYGVEQALDFLNIPELCRPCCAEEYVPAE